MNEFDTDPRVQCIGCTKLVNRICQDAKNSGLSRTQPTAPVGRDLATILQNCNAYSPRRPKTP